MAIPVPTVDDFQDSTVMLVIRKIVDYLKNELVPDINKNDVANITTSISGTVLTINIVMGDGTVKSTNVNLPEPGGESGPYPTGVTLTLSGTTLNFSMAMSNGTPINANVDLSSLNTVGGNDIFIIKESNLVAFSFDELPDNDYSGRCYKATFSSGNIRLNNITFMNTASNPSGFSSIGAMAPVPSATTAKYIAPNVYYTAFTVGIHAINGDVIFNGDDLIEKQGYIKLKYVYVGAGIESNNAEISGPPITDIIINTQNKTFKVKHKININASGNVYINCTGLSKAEYYETEPSW